MPLRLPDRLPAIDILKRENIFVMDNSRAHSQDIRPLRIVILNLMPLKITTETDLIRLLSNTPLQMDINFMKLKSHTPKNTPIEHMMMFYRDFESMRHEKFDGMIITGAPVETMDYEQVTYWDEIVDIFNWARTHVTSTLYICWAAQAGLYHYYGVPKYPLDKKMFGIFEQHTLQPQMPIFRGFDDTFMMPHSRHTEIHKEDILARPELQLIAESEDSGVSIVMADVSSLSRAIWSILPTRSTMSISAISACVLMWRSRATIIATTTRRCRLWSHGARTRTFSIVTGSTTTSIRRRRLISTRLNETTGTAGSCQEFRVWHCCHRPWG